MSTGGPGIPAHDHGGAVAVPHVDQLVVVEPELEVRPEAVGAVAVVVAPVVVHPGEGVRPILVPAMEEVEGVPRLVHVRVQEVRGRPAPPKPAAASNMIPPPPGLSKRAASNPQIRHAGQAPAKRLEFTSIAS